MAGVAAVLFLCLLFTTVITDLEDCVREHGIEEFQKCCQQGEILIKNNAGHYRLDHVFIFLINISKDLKILKDSKTSINPKTGSTEKFLKINVICVKYETFWKFQYNCRQWLCGSCTLSFY